MICAKLTSLRKRFPRLSSRSLPLWKLRDTSFCILPILLKVALAKTKTTGRRETCYAMNCRGALFLANSGLHSRTVAKNTNCAGVLLKISLNRLGRARRKAVPAVSLEKVRLEKWGSHDSFASFLIFKLFFALLVRIIPGSERNGFPDQASTHTTSTFPIIFFFCV